MAEPPTAPDAVARYYQWLWTSTQYSGTAPNDEERRRLEAITAMVQAALNHRGVPRFSRILDLGCGRGWLLPHLEPYGEVVGADPVPDAIAVAQRLFPTGRFVCQDASALANDPRYRGQFDLVVCSEVIEHAQDARDLLRAMARLLVPRGALVLTTPRGERFHAWSKVVPVSDRQPIENWLTERQLREAAATVGFAPLASRRLYAPFTDAGIYRLLNSQRLLRMLGRVGLASWFGEFRSRWALYLAVLLVLTPLQE
jgi:2-polyprenyl-3-methyl-5-hydroxy-6-metoxy-1,4-benzoquinol methylase